MRFYLNDGWSGRGQWQCAAVQGWQWDYANVRNEGCMLHPLSWGKCQEERFEYSLIQTVCWSILSEEQFSQITWRVLCGRYKQDIANVSAMPLSHTGNMLIEILALVLCGSQLETWERSHHVTQLSYEINHTLIVCCSNNDSLMTANHKGNWI